MTALCAHSYPNNLHLMKNNLLWFYGFFVLKTKKTNLLLFLIEIYNSNESLVSQPEVHDGINLTDCQINKQIGSAFQTLVWQTLY